MRRGGTQNHFLYQVRVFCGYDQGDHSALGGTEKTDVFQPERLKSLSCIPRHFTDGIRSGKVPAPVKNINGENVFERAVCLCDGVSCAHNALNAQARQDDQRLISFAETEIVHGERICDYGFNFNSHKNISSIFIMELKDRIRDLFPQPPPPGRTAIPYDGLQAVPDREVSRLQVRLRLCGHDQGE